MKPFRHLRPQLLALLTLTALFAASCERVVELDIDFQSHLVLNAVPVTDSALFANVSYTRYFLDNRQYPAVQGAEASLWANGAVYTSATNSNGNYFFNYVVQPGDSLMLTVRVDGHQPLQAATRVPQRPAVNNLVATIDTAAIIPNLTIKFDLADPAPQRNYYAVTLYQRDSGECWNYYTRALDTVDTLYATYFACYDLRLTSPSVSATEALLASFYSQLLFSDSLISGTDHSVVLTLFQLPDTSEHPGFIHQYTLRVESLAPDRYRYLSSVAAATSMTSYFAEPAQVYSNVAGGFGIFAGTARTEFKLDPVYKTDESPTAACIKQNKQQIQNFVKHNRKR